MILSRSKPALGSGVSGASEGPDKKAAPSLEDFLLKRDYIGAVTLLEFKANEGQGDVWLQLWSAFCYFHLGDYRRALDMYLELQQPLATDKTVNTSTDKSTDKLTDKSTDKSTDQSTDKLTDKSTDGSSHAEEDPLESLSEDLTINIAVCYFYLGMYKESQESADKAKESPLKTRLVFHLAHKLGDEAALVRRHQALRDVPPDQLCLASIHYLRGHYQQAIDVYKKLLLDMRKKNNQHLHEIEWLKYLSINGSCLALNVYVALCYYKLDYYDVSQEVLVALCGGDWCRSCLALNVYVALCYYKLDYYDVSQEVLGVYLAQLPDSTVAVNLKACNLFRLYNGKAAENELKAISSEQHSFGQDLVQHNLVVFRNGDGALKVWPRLVDAVPEARLNLAGWRLRAREPAEARALLEPLAPTSPLHYILRGVVAAALYNDTQDEEHMKRAEQSFHTVGSSASECDTIPGRQCMAAAYFLRGQPEEVLVYLNSIKSFFTNDDVFNFNYAQAKVATGFYKEAEECLLQVKDEGIRSSFTYAACLCRAHVMSRQGQAAWELCTKMAGTADSYALLQLVANDSYRMGLFIVAARAFNMLDRLEPNPEAWEGLRGAAAGVVQAAAAALAGGARAASAAAGADVREAVSLLRATRHAQADSMLRVITRWAHDNRITV